MNVNEIRKYNTKKYIVEFDTGLLLVLYKSDLNKYELVEGVNVSDELYSEMINSTLLPRAKELSLYYLGKRSRTEKEVEKNLRNKKYPDEVITRVMAFLKSYRMVDDRDYTERYVKDAIFLKKQSIKAIKYKLGLKGIKKELVEEFTSKYENNILDNIYTLVEKKMCKLDENDIKGQQKTVNFLLRRGYNYSDIKRAINLYKEQKNS